MEANIHIPDIHQDDFPSLNAFVARMVAELNNARGMWPDKFGVTVPVQDQAGDVALPMKGPRMNEEEFRDKVVDHTPRQTEREASAAKPIKQMINWLPIRDAAVAGLPGNRKVLVTDGAKVAVCPYGNVLDRFAMNATNWTHFAVITLPNGDLA